MTKQVKLSALIVALMASTGAMAHDIHGYTLAKVLAKWFATILANAGKTTT